MTSAAEPFQLNMPALREIAQSLSAAWDLDTTLDLIVNRTTALMGVDSCSLYLLDPDGDVLRLRASTGLSRRALGRATLAVGEGMTGAAVAENRPVHAAEARLDARFKHVRGADEETFTSLLAVPLLIESRPIGAMNVQTVAPRDYTPAEIEVLALVGDLAAGTLAKARLYEQQKRQIDELSALAAASEAVTSPQYLDEILEVVTEMAARTMNAEVCAIYLVNDRGTHLQLHGATHAVRAYRRRPPVPVEAGGLGEVYATGRSLYISDVRVDARYHAPELAEADGLVSLLAVPLSVRDRVIGVLACYTEAVRTFSTEQRAWFATLANQTALGIENAYLVSNAAVVREMHHRIKNNLQNIAMLMQLQLVDAERLTAREVLEANMHRVQSIATVHEVLSEKGFRLVNVRDVLARISQMTLEMLLLPGKSIDIHVEGDELPLPSRVATSLTLVLNELLQNALEHAFVGRESGEVRISLSRLADEFAIFVRDNGVGMPEEVEEGLGLEIVSTLVRDDLRGRMRVNRLPAGTEIVLRLPRTLEQNDQA